MIHTRSRTGHWNTRQAFQTHSHDARWLEAVENVAECYSHQKLRGVPAHSRIALFSGEIKIDFSSLWIPLGRFKTSTGLPAVPEPYAEWIFLEIWKLLILCWTQLSVSRACGSQSWLNLWLSQPLHLWRISSFLPTPNSSILQSSKSEPRGLKLPLDVVDLNKASNCVNRINPLKLPNWTKTKKLWLVEIRLKRETYICIMCTQIVLQRNKNKNLTFF